MKLLIPVTLAAMLFASCGSKEEKSDSSEEKKEEGWTDDDRERFTDLCMDKVGSKMNPNDGKEACDCTLGKLEDEYKNYADADRSGNENRIAELMQECLTPYLEQMNTGAWTQEQVDTYMAACISPMKGVVKDDVASSICTCGLEKLQEQFPNPSDIDQAAAQEIGKECAEEYMNQ